MEIKNTAMHQSKRNTVRWGTGYGSSRKDILLCNITNDHLANIIQWILNHRSDYDMSTLDLMMNEAAWRKLEPTFIYSERPTKSEYVRDPVSKEWMHPSAIKNVAPVVTEKRLFVREQHNFDEETIEMETHTFIKRLQKRFPEYNLHDLAFCAMACIPGSVYIMLVEKANQK